MLRESGYQPEYGVVGAGAVNRSIIGRLPSKTRVLGPVAAVSYRVASRIANLLKAGEAVRSADDLDAVRVILFHAPPDQQAALLAILKASKIHWYGKSLILCDCEPAPAFAAFFRAGGASVAVARRCGLAGRVLVEGSGPALLVAHRMIREMRLKSIEIAPGCGDAFEAAVTIGTAALTPLIDYAASLLRHSGLRDSEAVQIAVALFEQTAREYAHSGRQSWEWYVRAPASERLDAIVTAAGEPLAFLLRELMLFGLNRFEKHPLAACALREKPVPELFSSPE
jgi:hypothetical protein